MKKACLLLVITSCLQAMNRDNNTLILPRVDAQNPDKSAKKIDAYLKQKRKKAPKKRYVKVQLNIGENFYVVHAPLTTDGTPAIIRALLTETTTADARALKLPRII